MKRKVICCLLAVFAIAIFSLGCGGGGGSHSNPASPVVAGNAKVSGVIVDSDKKPVENLNVRLALISNSASKNLPENIRTALRLATADTQTEFNTTTDKNGVYSFENVPYGRYSLSANNGNTGVLRAVEVSENETSLSTESLKPFGTVTGKVVAEDGKSSIYGAMVSLADKNGTIIAINGQRSFTNNDGTFTLKYVPVGTEYQLTASLNGYEQITSEDGSAIKFTIPATAENLTFALTSELKLKASQSGSNPVIATATVHISGINEKVEQPIYVIAQNNSNKEKVYYNTNLSENVENKTFDCEVSIRETGTYNIFAISSDGKETDTKTFDTSNSDNKGVDLTFDSNTPSVDVKVNIVKITLPDGYDPSSLNYYDGYVSFKGSDNTMLYNSIADILEGNNWKTNSFRSGDYYILGKYAVYGSLNTDDNSLNILYYNDSTQGQPIPSSLPTINFGESSYIQRMAFIPDKYVVVDYSDNASKRYYITGEFGSDNTFINKTKNYILDETEEHNPYDMKMAKANNSERYYLATYESDNANRINIFEVSNANESVSPIAVSSEVLGDFGYDNNVFRVLNGDKFYIETSGDSSTSGSSNESIQAAIIDSNGGVEKDFSSNRKGCYIDQIGNIYRYDSSKKQVIKGTSLVDQGATPVEVDTSSSDSNTSNADLKGILGFEENTKTNTLTIYVY